MESPPTVKFSTVRLEAGYSREGVDRLLESVPAVPLAYRAAHIRQAQFVPVRIRKGYSMPEVDAYLESLAAQYEHEAASASGA